MKKQASIFCLSILLFSMCFTQTQAEEGDICWDQDAYPLYECRVENICEQYKSPKPVYNSEDYETADDANPEFHNQQWSVPALETAKALYRENMGNIYKCAIIQTQINSLKNLEKFIKQESSGKLDDTIWGQLSLRVNRLELSSGTIGCTGADKQSIQNKFQILQETTYQACKHINYLEYLKSYYEKTNSTFSDDEIESIYGENSFARKITPQDIEQDLNQRKNAVAEEISHTYQVFPIAYHAYSEYENNFPIHLLLEIIRADFTLLRENLRDNLMPIAQFGLKIINAMSQ